jgi:hypothetical protein
VILPPLVFPDQNYKTQVVQFWPKIDTANEKPKVLNELKDPKVSEINLRVKTSP